MSCLRHGELCSRRQDNARGTNGLEGSDDRISTSGRSLWGSSGSSKLRVGKKDGDAIG